MFCWLYVLRLLTFCRLFNEVRALKILGLLCSLKIPPSYYGILITVLAYYAKTPIQICTVNFTLQGVALVNPTFAFSRATRVFVFHKGPEIEIRFISVFMGTITF